MQFFVGTSGFSYKEWKGDFYPEKLPAAKMLSFYAERLSVVELNNTFYRMPKESQMESWAAQVPESFRFALKAPQLITHLKRLKEVAEPTMRFVQVASVLDRRQGPLLFQLPPNFKKDLPRLAAFLDLVRNKARVAFEFRHDSWLDGEVYELLRVNQCALCLADTDEKPLGKVVATAGWGYVRLRRENYTDAELTRWSETFRAQGWNEAYLFFKHEDTAAGPKMAARFRELAGASD